jgi:hypothetical protein
VLAPGLAPEPELVYPQPAAAIARDATRVAISSLNENRIPIFIRKSVTEWQAPDRLRGLTYTSTTIGMIIGRRRICS